MTSLVKSWLYQDLLEKPQEMMLYRQVEQGGLAMYNIKTRAMAMLIHTFIAQAANPKYYTNLYHSSLLRWHVFDDRSLPDPGKPPYYSSRFFEIIKEVKENTPLNIVYISVKQ